MVDDDDAPTAEAEIIIEKDLSVIEEEERPRIIVRAI